jgi:hypothetical protein
MSPRIEEGLGIRISRSRRTVQFFALAARETAGCQRA